MYVYQGRIKATHLLALICQPLQCAEPLFCKPYCYGFALLAHFIRGNFIFHFVSRQAGLGMLIFQKCEVENECLQIRKQRVGIAGEVPLRVAQCGVQDNGGQEGDQGA